MDKRRLLAVHSEAPFANSDLMFGASLEVRKCYGSCNEDEISRNFTLLGRHDGVARKGRHGRVWADELIRKVSRLANLLLRHPAWLVNSIGRFEARRRCGNGKAPALHRALRMDEDRRSDQPDGRLRLSRSAISD